MFGEYESESPRVPSPWDSLISSPRSLSPHKLTCRSNGSNSTDTLSTSISPRRLSPSPLLVPRLVPENDSGNIEYKLQLLDPSPARFARLVTQLKWRLLEGGGQAYYELGVADSGDLVGLGRDDLESSLDTLEMMAGEIGASVIVVKEIEVPAELAARYEEDARTNGQSTSWGDARGKRSRRREGDLMSSSLDDCDSTSASPYTTTETEDSGPTDGDYEDMQMTVVLEKTTVLQDSMADLTEAMAVFAIDTEEFGSDAAEAADASELDEDRLSLSPPQYAIDLEISSVYKPRPMRKRFHQTHPDHQHHHSNGQGHTATKQSKKIKKKPQVHHSQRLETLSNDGSPTSANKSLMRRQARDRRREEKKRALLAMATHETCSEDLPSTSGTNCNIHTISREHVDGVQAEAEILSKELEGLHVGVGSALTMSGVSKSAGTSLTSVRTNGTASAPTFTMDTAMTTQVPDAFYGSDYSFKEDNFEEDDKHGDVSVSPAAVNSRSAETDGRNANTRLIVEVLVVRKMSMEEGFLDFEGFSFV